MNDIAENASESADDLNQDINELKTQSIQAMGQAKRRANNSLDAMAKHITSVNRLTQLVQENREHFPEKARKSIDEVSVLVDQTAKNLLEAMARQIEAFEQVNDLLRNVGGRWETIAREIPKLDALLTNMELAVDNAGAALAELDKTKDVRDG